MVFKSNEGFMVGFLALEPIPPLTKIFVRDIVRNITFKGMTSATSGLHTSRGNSPFYVCFKVLGLTGPLYSTRQLFNEFSCPDGQKLQPYHETVSACLNAGSPCIHGALKVQTPKPLLVVCEILGLKR